MEEQELEKPSKLIFINVFLKTEFTGCEVQIKVVLIDNGYVIREINEEHNKHSKTLKKFKIYLRNKSLAQSKRRQLEAFIGHIDHVTKIKEFVLKHFYKHLTDQDVYNVTFQLRPSKFSFTILIYLCI